MFRPNLTCRIQLSGGNDVYGQPLPGTYITERCSIIKLMITNEKSSVRADSSASRGNAMELETHSVLLLTPKTKAKIDDVIEINGYKLRIMGMFARHNLNGVLDHYQVEARMWSKA